MSRKAFGDGPVKMTVLGILSAMLRGGRGQGARITRPTGDLPTPRGVGMILRQPAATAGVDARLLH